MRYERLAICLYASLAAVRQKPGICLTHSRVSRQTNPQRTLSAAGILVSISHQQP